MKAFEFREIRKRRLKMTQPELGRALGMGVNLVNSIECGEDTVPLRYEYAILWLDYMTHPEEHERTDA